MWKTWNGPIVERLMSEMAVDAVEKTCEVLLEKSKEEVPLDEGTLMRSGIYLMEKTGKPEAVISYGGGPGTGHPIVPYAVKWHENSANFQHGRKSRYLADPVNQYGNKVLRNALDEGMRRILK